MSSTQLDAHVEGEPNCSGPAVDPSNTMALPVRTPETEAGQERPKSRSHRKRKHNQAFATKCWEHIMKRHGNDLTHLPVPPQDFVERERRGLSSGRKDGAANRIHKRRKGGKVDLGYLASTQGDKKQRPIPKRENECLRWVLQPMTEEPPEPMPGVPSITVTDPEEKTWWPKDINSYMSADKIQFITKRATAEHFGKYSEFHCQLFQEYYHKGLDKKPYQHRPEVLFCTVCLGEQMGIEEEEKKARREYLRTCYEPLKEIEEEEKKARREYLRTYFKQQSDSLAEEGPPD